MQQPYYDKAILLWRDIYLRTSTGTKNTQFKGNPDKKGQHEYKSPLLVHNLSNIFANKPEKASNASPKQSSPR